MIQRLIVPVAGLLLAAGGLPGMAVAADFWVTNHADSGAGSLRWAIESANAASGDAHTIRFDIPTAGSIVLASPLPRFAKPTMTMSAFKAPTAVIIDGAGQFPLLTTETSVRTLRVSWVTLRNGRRNQPTGGGCLNSIYAGDSPGQLELIGVHFQNCHASWKHFPLAGGALQSMNQNVTIDRCVFEDNSVAGAGGAASIESGAAGSPVNVIVRDSSFIGNRARGNSDAVRGGALSLWVADTQIQRSRFVDNATVDSADDGIAVGTSGAVNLLNGSRLRVDSSLFLRNRSAFATIHHGAGWVDGFNHIRNSSFVANQIGNGPTLSVGTYLLDVRNNSFLETRSTATSRPVHLQHSATSGVPGPASALFLTNNVFGPGNQPEQTLCVRSGVSTASISNNVVAGVNPGCGMSTNASYPEIRVEGLLRDGGTLETVSVFADSVAIDTGHLATPQEAPAAACLPVDARGLARVRDGDADGTARCDIGPWESQAEASLFRDRFDPVLWRPAG